ncbi:MAG: FAD-binding oxidoreductase [Chloroflexi bacterium]|nr:FAD-binding oxidoreductase [Chloroflexota bacterium]
MRKTAEVVIIGGGVAGTSTAFHLAKRGCRNVVVLEKDTIGSGSTGRCAGGIRQQFSSEVNIRLSMESVRFFERFEEETGCVADFRQHGYLMLATTEADWALFQQNVALQRSLDVKVDLLSPREAREMVPQLSVDGIFGASFCPTDGFADPHSVVQGFASAARRLGARTCEGTPVIGIKMSGGRVCGVITTDDEYEAPVVVIAAGAYSGLVGRLTGLDIPVHAYRRHIFVTAPLDTIPRRSPMVIDFHTGFWCRREGPGLIFGMRNPEEPESFDMSVDWGFLLTIGEVACRHLSLFKQIGIMRGQAGLHDDTPDSSAIIGGVPEIEGLYLACGFSGHGFQHSPAVGRVVADLILDGQASPDISSLSLTRFRQQAFHRESSMV